MEFFRSCSCSTAAPEMAISIPKLDDFTDTKYLFRLKKTGLTDQSIAAANNATP